MVGQRIGDYDVRSELGRGGMGVVYRAHDVRLDRDIALKVLSPHLAGDSRARVRFEREARAASALEHDHICPVFGVGDTGDGRMWMAMPLYDGPTLRKLIDERGTVPEPEATKLACQAAAALAAAHERGIVHRDVKPGNLIVPDGGTLKVLDFGLAKLTAIPDVTTAGSTLGTVAYMSPEQTRGEPSGPETDVWSLGVVLFELLSGKPPFAGRYPTAVAYAVVHEDAPGLDIEDERLGDLVAACLRKPPAERPSMAEVRDSLAEQPLQTGSGEPWRSRKRSKKAAGPVRYVLPVLAAALILGFGLWSLTGPEDAGPRRVLILPFEDLSPGGNRAHLGEGLMAELVSSLRSRGVQIPGRSAARYVRTAGFSTTAIGDELNVDFVLDGTVHESGGELVVTAELISTKDGFPVWDDRYAWPAQEFMALEEELVGALAAVLSLKSAPPTGTFEPSWEAREAFMLGRHERGKQAPEALEAALAYFERATTLEPDYARAWAELVKTYGVKLELVRLTSEEVVRAERAAVMADSLAPGAPYSHRAVATAGSLRLDLATMLERGYDAVAADPMDAASWFEAGVSLLYVGELESAVEYQQIAHRLDPLDRQVLLNLIVLCAELGRLEDTRSYLSRLERIDPDYNYLLVLRPRLSTVLPDTPFSVDVLKALPPDVSVVLQADYFGRAGNHPALDSLAAATVNLPLEHATRMVLAAWAGNLDAAFAWAHEAVDEREVAVTFNHFVLTPDAFRNSPRFAALQARMNWPSNGIGPESIPIPVLP